MGNQGSSEVNTAGSYNGMIGLKGGSKDWGYFRARKFGAPSGGGSTLTAIGSGMGMSGGILMCVSTQGLGNQSEYRYKSADV